MKSKKSLPWLPAEYINADLFAFKALQSGTADAEQQKRALDWLINNLCDTYGMSFRPDDLGGERATVFAEGKRFVGSQVVKMLNINPTKEKA